jgi:hypothetical protein
MTHRKSRAEMLELSVKESRKSTSTLKPTNGNDIYGRLYRIVEGVFDEGWTSKVSEGSILFYKNFCMMKYIRISPSIDGSRGGEVRYPECLRPDKIPLKEYATAVADRLNQKGNDFYVVEEEM